MNTIKYRLYEPRQAPRRIKIEPHGWGGTREPRRDGSYEQPWHCIPFTESAQYGIELLYPSDNELHATKPNGRVMLDADWRPDPMTSTNWPPFRSFGEEHYTYQLLLDLHVADDMAVLTAPHFRYFRISVPICGRTDSLRRIGPAFLLEAG